MKTLINKANPAIRITAPEIITDAAPNNNYLYVYWIPAINEMYSPIDWTLVEEEPVDLEKFTKKIKTFQGRYKHPEIVSIKGAMAFMARMFYQYPDVARQWYEQLPKTTMDFNTRKEE